MEAILEAVSRDAFGKNESRRLRAKGQVPAVLYGGPSTGGTRQALLISIDPKKLMGILRSGSGVNTLIGLKVAEEDVRVLVKEYQVDPVSHRLLHVDFFRVAMHKRLVVTVPVTTKGEPKGVKQQGGMLDFVHREVEIECLPANIPEHLEIDVSEMLIGQSVRLRDLATNPNWSPVSDPDLMLVHVVPQRTTAAPAEGTPEAATPGTAEPDVVKKGKGEKGEDEKK